MKYCIHCGAQLPDDAQFCPGCGKAVGDGASATSARKIPLPTLLAVLAVALVAGVVFALTRGGSSQEAPGAPQSGESTATVTATASPTPTETPVASPAPTETPQPVQDDGSWLVAAAGPWKGAWCTEDGAELMIFESWNMNASQLPETNEDGSITIYCTDVRGGTPTETYLFSADQTTLTHLDYTGKTLATYRRPTYDMAPTPLPSSDWGAYTMVEGDATGYNPYGPSVDFLVDAFRFGSCPYQRLSDNGDGTLSIYCPSGPEGFFTVFSFSTEGEDTYLTIYDADGNVRYRYLRTAA